MLILCLAHWCKTVQSAYIAKAENNYKANERPSCTVLRRLTSNLLRWLSESRQFCRTTVLLLLLLLHWYW